MAAERILGNPRVFDNQLISLSHPDGFAALSTGRQITAHFTSPPFLASALELPGARQILSGTEAFGSPFTFLVGAAAEGWGVDGSSKKLLEDFLLALERAMVIGSRLQEEELAEEDAQVLLRLAKYYDLDPQTLHQQLRDPDLRFSSEVQGLEEFGQAMDRFGYLEWPFE
jgi:NitT/TauT family transport system substrate-binding protein